MILYNENIPLYSTCFTYSYLLIFLTFFSIKHNNNYNSPLHWACISGAATSTNYLVNEVKANIFAQASDGNSPLHLASECGHVDLVNVIVTSAGPKKTELFDLKTSEGKTAGELAKIEKKKDVSKALKAAGDKTAGGSSVCIIS